MLTKKNFTDDEIKLILHKSSKSYIPIIEIAREFDVYPYVIVHLLQSYGIKKISKVPGLAEQIVNDNQEEIIDLYKNQGLIIDQIAKYFQISRNFISNLLIRNGITLSLNNLLLHQNKTQRNDEIIKLLLNNSLSIPEISKKYNIGRKTIITIKSKYCKLHSFCFNCKTIKEKNKLLLNNKCMTVCSDCRENLKITSNKKINQRKINKLKISPIKRLHYLFSKRIRNALKSLKLRKITKTFENLPYSIIELKQHLESQFEDWMTWENWGVYDPKTWNDHDLTTWTWQLDHIKPIKSFDIKKQNDVEFIKCWALENLRPLSSKKNILDSTNAKFNKPRIY